MNPARSTIATVVDLLLFHTLERQLFNRLVGPMNKNPKMVKLVIALWMWLEEIGHYRLIRTIFSHVDRAIDGIFNESILCLSYIAPNATQPTDSNDTPIMARLCNEPINSRFFYYHRDFVRNNISRIMREVCEIIFGENAAREVGDPTIRSVPIPFGDGSTSLESIWGPSAMFVNPSTETTSTASTSTSRTWSSLNPQARPFMPIEHTPQDQRSMFLTFSRGYPLTKEEVEEFFISRWGPVVESVTIERASPGVAPQYGRIIFTNPSVIPLVLNGQSKAKFEVRGRHLWARLYVPRNN